VMNLDFHICSKHWIPPATQSLRLWLPVDPT
jgi:hypothetical protein